MAYAAEAVTRRDEPDKGGSAVRSTETGVGAEAGAGQNAGTGAKQQPRMEPEIIEYDVARVEKVYRKLDLRIIPPFWVLYFLCSAIRSNIGIAQTMNAARGHDLEEVLHLSARDVSTALALFYVSYVLFDFPSNLIMTRLSPRVWMARIVFAVGVIGTCFTAVNAAWSLKLLRFLLGVVIAGMWPGMAYYLTLFYPPSRLAKRVGMYFTAAQLSAAVVGLVSAGFQQMDGLGGLVGFQWMFLVYGLLAVLLGVALLWWLPDRPLVPGQTRAPPALARRRWLAWIPQPPEALTGEDALVHYHDLRRVYHPRPWTLRDLARVLVDWRLWPLLLMYFGVVGVGIGTQLYGSVIIAGINPHFSSVVLSLLFAPIWIMDLIAILLVTPLSDRFHHYRAVFFSAAVCIQIAGLLVVCFAPERNPYARYGGMLMLGFGLGPTVPICMTWTNEIFQRRHGEVGVAAASALVSGLGNLGSITTTYALYTGWPADAAPGPHQYRNSNLVMIAILCVSIASSFVNVVLLRVFGNEPAHRRAKRSSAGSGGNTSADDEIEDGAARRERQQRGFKRILPVGR
ncbi:vitamin h transporter 1 [Niveomyces insectorum RCEF 264]|uniref:Vitamin h transporter 1 n=1 Tax=Niveomyces insectorum RCEF 264 TaxID=1081102 RepID=A0A167S157_9HYPO|nr:vitamin h transporter 1 [Niveomyces insectorum RCEF 264]